jgi:hypothetical protein
MTDAAMRQYTSGCAWMALSPPHLLDAEAPYVHARVEYLDVPHISIVEEILEVLA